ncbi:hypothetical protein CSPX01_03970, partial [Colletotrichum filicis]
AEPSTRSIRSFYPISRFPSFSFSDSISCSSLKSTSQNSRGYVHKTRPSHTEG